MIVADLFESLEELSSPVLRLGGVDVDIFHLLGYLLLLLSPPDLLAPAGWAPESLVCLPESRVSEIVHFKVLS